MRMFRKIIDQIDEIKIGISNFWKWRKIIWNDRNYDHNFFLKIMKTKLEIMLNNWEDEDVYVGQEKDKEKMKICIYLLNRLISENYDDNAFYFHNKKWGKLRYNESNFFPMLTRSKIRTKEDAEQERKEFQRLMFHEDYLINQDLDYLFKLLKRHLRKWWL